jgi:hypothetical protein
MNQGNGCGVAVNMDRLELTTAMSVERILEKKLITPIRTLLILKNF